MKNKKVDFTEYWEHVEDPMHGHTDDAWPLRYAKEVLFYLKEGDKIFVDTGCGTGDILKVLSSRFEKIYGVDFSQAMIDKAELTFNNSERKPIFYCDNMLNIDKRIPEKVDIIFNNHSLQYLTLSEVGSLIENSDRILNEQGRILFFNVPDANKRWLYLAEFYGERGDKPFSKVGLWKEGLRLRWNVFKARIKNPKYKYYDGVGYWFYKDDIINVANSKGFECKVTNSIYPPYGYRFNVVISRKK